MAWEMCTADGLGQAPGNGHRWLVGDGTEISEGNRPRLRRGTRSELACWLPASSQDGEATIDVLDFEMASRLLIERSLRVLLHARELCEAAFELLHPGGALFLVCHDRRALSARALGTRSPIFDIEHLQLFSPESLRYVLRESGFGSVRLERVHNRYPLSYWTKLLPLPTPAKRLALKVLARSGLGQRTLQVSAGNLAAIGFKPQSPEAE